jgi:hypothetical protein
MLLYLTTSSAANADAVTIFIPRLKLMDDNDPVQGEFGQTITMPFQAVLPPASVATSGIEQSTIQIVDTTV